MQFLHCKTTDTGPVYRAVCLFVCPVRVLAWFCRSRGFDREPPGGALRRLGNCSVLKMISVDRCSEGLSCWTFEGSRNPPLVIFRVIGLTKLTYSKYHWSNTSLADGISFQPWRGPIRCSVGLVSKPTACLWHCAVLQSYYNREFQSVWSCICGWMVGWLHSQ